MRMRGESAGWELLLVQDPAFIARLQPLFVGPSPGLPRNLSWPLPWFSESKDFSHLTSQEERFDVYLRLPSRSAFMVEAACKDRFNPLSRRSDKTLFSHLGS